MPSTGTSTDLFQSYARGSIIEHIMPNSTKRDKTQKPTKCTVRDPEIAVPYIGKEEYIHFGIASANSQKESKNNFTKKRVGSH